MKLVWRIEDQIEIIERKIFAVNIGVQGAVVDEGQFPVIMLFSREDIVGIAHLIVLTEDLFHFESRH